MVDRLRNQKEILVLEPRHGVIQDCSRRWIYEFILVPSSVSAQNFCVDTLLDYHKNKAWLVIVRQQLGQPLKKTLKCITIYLKCRGSKKESEQYDQYFLNFEFILQIWHSQSDWRLLEPIRLFKFGRTFLCFDF